MTVRDNRTTRRLIARYKADGQPLSRREARQLLTYRFRVRLWFHEYSISAALWLGRHGHKRAAMAFVRITVVWPMRLRRADGLLLWAVVLVAAAAAVALSPLGNWRQP